MRNNTMAEESIEVAGVKLPNWTTEELRVLVFLLAVRLDAVMSLLEKNTNISRDQLSREIENSVEYRKEKIIESLTIVPEEQRPVAPMLGIMKVGKEQFNVIALRIDEANNKIWYMRVPETIFHATSPMLSWSD